jgi:hypothetical protein
VAARTEFGGQPAPFLQAVEQIKRADLRPEIVLDEMPAPQRIAPYAFALSGDVLVGEDELATGRFILLHDPAGNDAWEGDFRCVTFARADIETDVATDPLVTDVGWSWLTDALAAGNADHHAASGSITIVRSDSFGAMESDGSSAQIEVRASWTPDSDLAAHAEGWMHLLCAIGGLPPLSPGVIPLRRDRR